MKQLLDSGSVLNTCVHRLFFGRFGTKDCLVFSGDKMVGRKDGDAQDRGDAEKMEKHLHRGKRAATRGNHRGSIVNNLRTIKDRVGTTTVKFCSSDNKLGGAASRSFINCWRSSQF